MNRKTRMASALILADLVLVSLPAPASATGPLLSGYGGPGAGEQSLIGSTLLSGPRGGAGSSGSPNAGGPSSVTALGRSGGGSDRSTAPVGESRGVSHPSRHGSVQASAHPNAYVYSNFSPSAASSLLGMAGDELLLLVSIIAGLGLTGALTRRLAVLQG